MKAWQANMDMQPVFHEFKAVTFICQYFSKTEGQCSQGMKQRATKPFEKNMHHHDIMKTIARAYLSNRECSVQEAVYHVLPELNLRRIFLAVYFVNTNLPEETAQVLLFEKELSEPPNDSSIIFKKNMIFIWKYQLPHSTIQCFK